ncbi:MAG: hypothetical protein WD491_01050, partial [Balneolales bacterium]
GVEGESRFARQLNAMRWNLGGAVSQSGDDYRLSFSNRFNSRLYMTGGVARNAQDENVIALDAIRWFSDNLGAAAEARSYTFTTTSVSQNIMLGGLAIRPIDNMEIRALSGFMSDRRSDKEDQGAAFALRGKMDPFSLGEFNISPEFSAERALITPRSYQNLSFQTGASFRQEDVELQAHLAIGQSTRESYQPSSFFNRNITDIVESVSSDTTEVNLAFSFPIAGAMTGQLDVRALSNDRLIESRLLRDDLNTTLYDSKTQRQQVNIRYVTEYPIRSQPISLGFEYTYINRENSLVNTDDIAGDQVNRQREILQNSNYNQSRFELFSNNSVRLSEHNYLHAQARVGIMRYDTPELNSDDRDELAYNLQIGNRHRFSDYLDGQITATAEALHYVYLHAERSVENNRRRSIRLVPELNWNPGRRLSIRQRFLIRANYTVEDYEMENRAKNDRSSREFEFQTEINYNINNDWSFEFQGSRSELRIGRLFWDTFQEIPIDTLITYDTRLMLVRHYDNIRVAAGGRYFLRLDQLLQTTLSTTITGDGRMPFTETRTGPGRQQTHQFGPTVEISIPFVTGNRLYINGWLQKQSVRKNLFVDYPEEVASAFAQEENRHSTRIIPNLELRANFSF